MNINSIELPFNEDVTPPSKKKTRLPRRISVQKSPMTQEKADAIRHMHKTTKLTQFEIGELFGVNQGNVSKILNNIWYPAPTRH